MSCTLLRVLGVLIRLGLPEGGRAREPFEVGGPLFGTGPRFGAGPRGGTRPGAAGPRKGAGPVAGALRRDVGAVGKGRRLEAETRGGAISEGEEEGSDGGGMLPFNVGGAMAVGRGGGDMVKLGGLGAGFEARCAEFSAGNEGGGRLSSSSLSLELWCSSSVKDGMAGAFALLAVALGVTAGDRSWSGMFFSSCPCDSAFCSFCCLVGPSSPSCDSLGVAGAAESCTGAK